MKNAEAVSDHLMAICDNFRGILLDASGVFWGGQEYGLLPGSKEMMQKLVSRQKIVGILSNSTQLAFKEIEKLKTHGLVLGKHFHFYITSGDITRHHFLNQRLPFKTPKNRYYVFGEPHPAFNTTQAIFANTAYQETLDIFSADFIYTSVPHINGKNQIDSELFREEVKKLMIANLPMICPNPDLFAHEETPPKAVVRQGSIAKLYEELGGQVFYFGKPDKTAYSLALEQFRQHILLTPSEILMIGDTPHTDIRGANNFGMASALVTQTGIMADEISKKGLKLAIENLKQSDYPTYFITRFFDGIPSSS